MATLEDRLADPEYRNWVKVGLCLNYLKEGLVSFVDQECQLLHQDIQSNIPGPFSATPVLNICTTCSNAGIKYQYDKRTKNHHWTINCPNGICDKYLSEITNHHVSPTSREITWRNTDVKMWSTEHWEIAKCYMGSGQGGATAVRTDVSGILNMMIHCTWFQGKILCKQVRAVRDVRNAVMHSTDMKITTGDFKKFTNDMIDLLEDQAQLKTLQEPKAAVQQIRKIISAAFIIGQNDEQKVILDKVADLETQCAELKSDHQKSEEDRRNENEQVTKELAAVRQITDRLSNMEGLEKRVQHLEQEMSNSANKPKRECDLDKLHETLLTAYEECYTYIPVSPLYEKKTIPLEQLYTDAVIIEETDTLKHANKEQKEIPVTSYRDIFYDKEKRVRSIYILGDPGSGKTVYSQQMVNTWLMTQKKLRSGETQLMPNEEIMKGFRYLFYIPLRHLKRTDELKQAVEESLPSRQENEKAASKVLGSAAESILIICDGLDEIEGFPSRDNMHMFTVVTTTRPWKYDLVRGKTNWQDRILKLRGIGKAGLPKLVQRLLVTYYEDSSVETTGNKFIQSVEKLGLTQSLSDSPLMLIYMLHIWKETNTLSPSLTKNLIGIIECLLSRSEIREKEKEQKISKGDPLLLSQDFKSDNMTGLHLLGELSYKYGKVLMTAADIAYRGLTNKKKEHTLVFSESSLEKILRTQNTELQACLKLGILTKSEKIHVLHTEHNIAFPHKLFQELFLSLRIVNNESALTEFKIKHYNSVEKVLEMSQVLKFTVALCPKTALELSKHVIDVCNVDNNIKEFRSMLHSDLTSQDRLVRDISEMYVSCVEEHNNARPTEKCQLYISDIHVQFSKVKWELLLQLIPFNNSRIQSFTMTYIRDKDLLGKYLLSLNSDPAVKSMTRFCIDLDGMGGNDVTHLMPAINDVIANNTALTTLQLEYGPAALTGLCLPPLHHLQHLYLSRFPTTTDFLHQLTSLLAMGHLRTLQLRHTNIGDFYMNISHPKQLYHLTLRHIAMSHTSWCRLLEGMNDLPALRELVLLYPHITPHYDTSPQPNLHLPVVSRLHMLMLWHVPPSSLLQLVLCNVTEGSQMRRLNVVNLYGSFLPASSVQYLLSAIQHVPHLEVLELWHINTDNQLLRLENNQNLKSLKLYHVTMSTPAWSHLFVTIQSLPHLDVLELLDVNTSANVVRVPPHLRITSKEVRENGNIGWLTAEGLTYHQSQ